MRFETGAGNFYGSTPTCSSPRADYWEPVTTVQVYRCCDRFANSSQRDADHSRAVQRSQRHAAPSPLVEPTDPLTPTSFTGQAIRTMWSLFIAKGRLLGTGHLEYEVYRVLCPFHQWLTARRGSLRWLDIRHMTSSSVILPGAGDVSATPPETGGHARK